VADGVLMKKKQREAQEKFRKKIEDEANKELKENLPFGAVRGGALVYQNAYAESWSLGMKVRAYNGTLVQVAMQAVELWMLREGVLPLLNKLRCDFPDHIPIPDGCFIVWDMEELPVWSFPSFNMFQEE